MTDFDEADIRAMRRDGSLRDFLRHESRPTRTTTNPAPLTPRPRGNRPGAWPAGTQPPSPIPPQPPGAWDAALTRYRAWMAAGRPPGDFSCDCGCAPRSPARHQSPEAAPWPPSPSSSSPPSPPSSPPR